MKRKLSPLPPSPLSEPHRLDVRAALLAWYERERRDLPWRRTKDPYAIWLSEVMLQQTQVATVIPYWERFLSRFPTVESLASARMEEVLEGWKGLGYYSRARNLHRAAQAVVEHFGGRFPSTAKELLTLPGFGPYTAGAVASIAFGEAAPLVDGNVARVLSRLCAMEGAPGDKVREARLWSLAAELVQGERPGDFNQAMMELGARVCRPENPLCLLCPVRPQCQAFIQGRVSEFPAPKIRKPPKPLTLALAVWWKAPRLLFARRAEKGLFGGLWELPAAEVAASASETEAQGSLSEALGAPLQVRKSLGEVRRQLTHRDLTLKLWRVEGSEPPASPPPGFLETRWCTAEEALELGMSTAMRRALEATLASLRSED